ncbi:HAD family hydrolase [Dialister sp.]|jgi:phosphoglycolate phosphatase|uniref:HAD family hydrolase n=1 Tax=Dialister sp. TaxID=1955814 RepID=UPI003A5BED2B
MYKAVIFDMDGTILDTITDITDSVNYALARMGERHDFTADRVKLCFGSGIRADMEKTLALSRGCSDRDIEFVGNSISVSSFGFTEKDVDRLESIFNPYYTAHSRNHTGPYEGIEPLLRKLKEKHVLTAVASNKNDGDVKNLSDGLFPGLFSLSMGNSPAIHRKPAPDMIDRILQELGVPRIEALYVGDSEVDIETAKNSRVPCISVAWGFRTVEFLKNHGASVIVNRPEELASLLLDSEQHACGQSHRHGASGF